VNEKSEEYVENHDAFIHNLYEITTTKAKLKNYIKKFKKRLE